MPTTTNIPAPDINLVFNFCFFKSNCNFSDNLLDKSIWLDWVFNILSKFVTLPFKLNITLSLTITFVSNKRNLLDNNFISSFAPSPFIKSLITRRTIGFFIFIDVLSITVCEKPCKLIIIKTINGINFFIYFIF